MPTGVAPELEQAGVHARLHPPHEHGRDLADHVADPVLDLDRGPVVRTFAGVLEVSPEWVHAHRNEVTLVDVPGGLFRWQALGFPLVKG